MVLIAVVVVVVVEGGGGGGGGYRHCSGVGRSDHGVCVCVCVSRCLHDGVIRLPWSFGMISDRPFLNTATLRACIRHRKER